MAPFNMDLARDILGSRIFYFADPGLSYLLTNYIAAGSILLEQINAGNDGRESIELQQTKGFFLDLLYLLQGEFDLELERRNAQMKAGDRAEPIRQKVREMREKWSPDSSGLER